MVTKSIPEKIIEEFIDSLKTSSLFDDVLVKTIDKLVLGEEGVSKKGIMAVISSEVEK